MAKYINLEELMKFPIRRNHYDKEHGNEHFIYGIETVLEYAENLPAADVTQVRHGHWDEGHEMMTCTNCCEQFDLYFKNDFNYCPNCGAKMDEVSE